jgi:hypothetical protein
MSCTVRDLFTSLTVDRALKLNAILFQVTNDSSSSNSDLNAIHGKAIHANTVATISQQEQQDDD